MTLFWTAILILLSSGIPVLLLNRKYTAMKAFGSVTIAAGCLMGLYEAGSRLLRGDTAQMSFHYLRRFRLSFEIDGLSAFFLVTIFFVSLLAAVYSYHYLHEPRRNLATAFHYLFFGILVAAMALVVTAADIVTFMLCWEIMSLSSFFLVLFNYQEAENRKAGYLYFVFSHIGAMFLLTAFGIIYAHTGAFEFGDLDTLSGTAKTLVFLFAFIGFGSKAGVFPLHVWLPHAHPAAPSHVSAVMSGVMIKTGIYGILRIYTLLNDPVPLFGEVVLTAGMISGVLGVVYALGQHDLKRLLAYHSVENIGIILMGLGIGMIGVSSGKPVMAVLGFAGGLLHVLNHSIFKSLLFMGAGAVLQKTGARTMDELGGLLKRMRVTGATFFIGSLAISGLPPLNGFVSEFLIYLGGFKGTALSRTDFVLSVSAVISLAVIGGLALACFSKVVGVVFQGEPRTPAAQQVDEVGASMRLPMMVLAAACILIGVLPSFFVQLTVRAVNGLGLGYGRIPLEPFSRITANISLAALVVLLLFALLYLFRTYLYRGKPVGLSGTWGCGFTRPAPKMQYTAASYAASILEFFRPAAPLVENHPPVTGRFPRKTHYHSHIYDIAELRLIPFIVLPVTWLFDRLRWLQHGDIHLYIGYILAAIIVLLFFI
ncbi:MAG: proton-conducting transporter membrane subunit [Thermodesulfobacteriota bacterium]